MQYELTTTEYEIANKILDSSFLKEVSAPKDLLFWAVKLAALVEANGPHAKYLHRLEYYDRRKYFGRLKYLYELLGHCLYCEARARELVWRGPYYSSRFSPMQIAQALGPEAIRDVEHWKGVYAYYAYDAKLSACQAVQTVTEMIALIEGVSIDVNALVPKDASTVYSTEGVLRVGYTALTTDIGTRPPRL